jgi:hypothetical protein
VLWFTCLNPFSQYVGESWHDHEYQSSKVEGEEDKTKKGEQGMVALQGWREDGTTRTSIGAHVSQRLNEDLVRSLYCLLEGWPQIGKALVSTCCSIVMTL